MLERVLARLTGRFGATEVDRYFRGQALMQVSEGLLEVKATTGFVAEQMARKFHEPLLEAAQAEIGRAIEVKFTCEGRAGRAGVRDGAQGRLAGARHGGPSAGRTAMSSAGSQGSTFARYRLEDFIVGESNRLAFTAAETLTAATCPRSFTSLFIHGPCGVGKTHLLQGIAARFKEHNPGGTVRCITGETFTNEFITALRTGRIDAFRKMYRGVDLLCIDDVHFLERKDATQEELLHTFNAIDLTGARVVLVSDEHPRVVRKFSDALVSRFVSGMVVKVDLPEMALRERLTRAIAERKGLKLEPSAASLIASRCGGPGASSCSVRDIEGAVARVDALRTLLPDLGSGPEIGLAAVRKALGLSGDSSPRTRRPVRMEAISGEVCRSLGVQLEEVLGRSKHARVVLARTLCAYIARQLTTMSFPEIARSLGRSNHSTVVTAAKRFERQLAADKALDLGSDPGPDLGEMSVRGLLERLMDDIKRSAAIV